VPCLVYSEATLRNMRLFPAAAAAAFLALGSVPAAQAQLITNGSFETGDFTGWTLTAPNGGTPAASVAGAPGTYFQNVPKPDGSFISTFGGENQTANALLTQTFATVSGTEYVLRFFYAAGGEQAQSLQVQAVDVLTSATLLTQDVVDSTPVADVLNIPFDEYTYVFTATGENTRLSFRDTSTNTTSTDGLLDNVRVSAAVPEPSAAFLLALGALPMGALIARRRTRRSV